MSDNYRVTIETKGDLMRLLAPFSDDIKIRFHEKETIVASYNPNIRTLDEAIINLSVRLEI